MLIGGLQKLSLIDYPGKLAATVFTVGCNFLCPFCHNSDLVLPEEIKNHPKILEKDFFEFLKGRRGLLEGVCITGGEPTIQKDLSDFIGKIKNLGFLVKLDTNGTNPKILESLIKNNLVDYIAMDIKAPAEKYSKVSGKKTNIKDIGESISIVKSAPEYEFRTTVVPGLLDEKDLLVIAQWLEGSKNYYIQQFVPKKTVDPAFEDIDPYSQEKLKEFYQRVQPYFRECQLRL